MGEPMDLQSKTVAELKEMLKEQGLPVSGNKSQLIERLEGQRSDRRRSEFGGRGQGFPRGIG